MDAQRQLGQLAIPETADMTALVQIGLPVDDLVKAVQLIADFRVSPGTLSCLLQKHQFPTVERWLSRCQKLSLTSGQVDIITDLAEEYPTSVGAIIRHLENGLELHLVQECLDGLDGVNVPRGGVTVLARLKALANDETPLEDILADIEDILTRIGGNFPVHRLIYIIEDDFRGDFSLFRQMARENPDGIIALIQRQCDRLTLMVGGSDFLPEDEED
ncbi:MAG: hypothetical protein CEN88_78 [Candidatus Berkelbacteria bacterium Licking1014_2]|uniref:Uncharacterized protein n=1 Tax=Candidatus Berkelbacteria bacterium Licking1014_2 TaxID=2017146 RepID=A0A554LXG2_9BACT|nr:MAG: hypothetical protein CEN88_78 [Candidatus Berkelbacteria bacterium Licking1014_2]